MFQRIAARRKLGIAIVRVLTFLLGGVAALPANAKLRIEQRSQNKKSLTVQIAPSRARHA
jgi:hypothetical protein